LPGLPGRWNYPAGKDAILYIQCGPYSPDEDPDEQVAILRGTGGMTPTVALDIDISGRVPGDHELRSMAELVLARFGGLAFDDFMSFTHGWTIDEIRANKSVQGLHFFDYREAHKVDEAG